MKRISTVVLSFLLLYAGVAWAFEACLRHDGHSHHTASGHHSHVQTPVSHDDSQHPFIPVIHCSSVSYQFGHAMEAASTQIAPSSKSVRLHGSLLEEALEPVFGNNLWLEALFKKILTFSLPNELSRHLFLSILQI